MKIGVEVSDYEVLLAAEEILRKAGVSRIALSRNICGRGCTVELFAENRGDKCKSVYSKVSVADAFSLVTSGKADE